MKKSTERTCEQALIDPEIEKQIVHLEQVAQNVAEDVIAVMNKYQLSPLQSLCILDAISKSIVHNVSNTVVAEAL